MPDKTFTQRLDYSSNILNNPTQCEKLLGYNLVLQSPFSRSFLKFSVGIETDNPAGISKLLKVNYKNTRTRCEICSKLTI